MKAVMEWPNLETLSKKCDGKAEVETNREKAVGMQRQQTHNGILGEKVRTREKSEYNE